MKLLKTQKPLVSVRFERHSFPQSNCWKLVEKLKAFSKNWKMLKTSQNCGKSGYIFSTFQQTFNKFSTISTSCGKVVCWNMLKLWKVLKPYLFTSLKGGDKCPLFNTPMWKSFFWPQNCRKISGFVKMHKFGYFLYNPQLLVWDFCPFWCYFQCYLLSRQLSSGHGCQTRVQWQLMAFE